MSESNRAAPRQPSPIIDAWRRFWYRPEPMYTLGLVRIAFGVLIVVWALWLLPVMRDTLFATGVMPSQPAVANTWGIFEFWRSDQAIVIGWVVLLLSGIALTVGWHSRLAAVLVLILVMSLQRRDPLVFNAGDTVVRVEALLIALSPCGAALSLDQRRKTGLFWSAQTRPIWPIRLMQIQLSVIYLATVQLKVSGETWLNGTAVSYALRLVDMQRLTPPHWVAMNALLMNLVTWGTLVIELSIGILVWNRRCRPWVLGAGVLMHLGIDMTIMIGIFSWAMFVFYLVWVSPSWVEQLPNRLSELRKEPAALLRRRRLTEVSTGSPNRRKPSEPRQRQELDASSVNGSDLDEGEEPAQEDIPHVHIYRPERAGTSAIEHTDASMQS